jgi:hypothetical protein
MTSQTDIHATETYENIERIERQGLLDWIRNNIGGEIIRIRRQRRWRPIWHVDVEVSGKIRSLVFKGSRVWPIIPYSLDHEINMNRVLRNHHIPVANVLGKCESPPAMVMDRIGDVRDAGMVLESMEKGSKITADRWQGSLEYIDILVRMHGIDPRAFELAGARMPVGADEIALGHFNGFYKMMLDAKIVEPFVEFCAIWLRRNVPKHRTKIAFVTGDSGQFLTEGKELKAVIDMEIGHLGDPLHDLACYRGRHPVEDMGDLSALFRRYAQASGQEIDLQVLGYHTVVFMTLSYLAPFFGINQTMAGGDWAESTVQSAFVGRRCAESLAELIGVGLDESIQLPDPHPAPIEEAGLRKLISDIRRMPVSDLFPEWQRNLIAAIPHYMINQLRYGRWVEDEDLNDTKAVLGYRPKNRVAADLALREFVLQAGPEHDAALIRLFHRRLLRWCHSIAGPDAPANHLLFLKMDPLSTFKL